ncbi:restriction endonuclease subunit S domain-containing protein [Bacillus ndiopicus]|uniref:hypothetical protein n=1 Tax=Bacillus ndiopicus TaxID=1347368 RepID=UPI0005A936ED|nr:hypothetical protein [Bacillus ndiopicus]
MQQYKLDHLAKIVKDATVPPSNYFANEGIPFVNSEHWGLLKNIQYLPKIQHPIEQDIYLTKVPAGTVLIHSIEKAYHICQQELYIGKNIIAIIPCQSMILSEYLFYYLQAQPLVIEEIEQQIVQLPSIETQQKLIARFAQWQAILEQIQKILTTLPQLEQYMLTENIYLLRLQKEQKELIEKFKWIGDIHKVLLYNMTKKVN